MARRQVPVDWGSLEMALTSHMDEWANYLDLRTGQVRMVHVAPFGDEEDELSEEEIDTGLAAGDLVFVEPLPASEEYEWMVEFADSVTEPRLRELLEVALDGRGAFRRFKNVLLDHPEEHEIEATTKPGEGPQPVSLASSRGRRMVRGLRPVGFAAVFDAKDEDGLGCVVSFEGLRDE